MKCKHLIPLDMCVACRVERREAQEMQREVEEKSGMCSNPACQGMRAHTQGLRDQFNRLVFVVEALLARHGDMATLFVKDAQKEIGERGLSFNEQMGKRGVEVRVKLVPKEEPKHEEVE